MSELVCSRLVLACDLENNILYEIQPQKSEFCVHGVEIIDELKKESEYQFHKMQTIQITYKKWENSEHLQLKTLYDRMEKLHN